MIIDTTKVQELPSWATLVENKTFGKIEWKPEDFDLYLSEEQKTGYITGHTLREKLKDEPVMNLAMAQFFLDNPKLYPEAWKGKWIYFWGTIVQHSDGYLRVPYLIGRGDLVVLSWYWLAYYWHSHYPALRFGKSLSLRPSEPLVPLAFDLRLKNLESDMEKIKKIINLT